jgi:hypothetical protein
MAIPLIQWMEEAASVLAAGRPSNAFQPTYVGLAVLGVLLVLCLIKAFRVWEEIHDVEEPASPVDLLESFEQAHAAGELDDEEFARVRQRLTQSQTTGQETSSGPPGPASAPEVPPGE